MKLRSKEKALIGIAAVCIVFLIGMIFLFPKSLEDVDKNTNEKNSIENSIEEDINNNQKTKTNVETIEVQSVNVYKQMDKHMDLELLNKYYTSCTQPIRFLNEWKSMKDVVENGNKDISDGYRWFYEKHLTYENEDGYIFVTDEVKEDVKKLAKSRGYTADWKEFFVYSESDIRGEQGYTGSSGKTYIKQEKNSQIPNMLDTYTTCTRGIKFLDQWESIENVVEYGDVDMVNDYLPFYNKYVGQENSDGYIKVNNEVLNDIKELARKRGYADDWKEFLLIVLD